jgi:hypothetical protein
MRTSEETRVDKGLLFYDAAAGHGEFYTINQGRIGRTRLHIGWRTNWTQIIPGQFGGGTRSDLLFYAPGAVTGQFYTTDDDAKITLLRTHTNWRSTWARIVPGNFGGDGFTDLLFYDNTNGTAEFYTTDGQGNISLLRQHTNFRRTWAQIVPGNFGGNGFTDLVFYDPTATTGQFYATDGQGGISLLRTYTNWRSTWTQIIPGDFGGNGFTDLLFYEAPAGRGEFYSTNGRGDITLLRAYTDWRHSWTRIIAANFSERSRCIRLHWKSLLPIDSALTTFINEQTQRMSELYATSGLTVVRGTTEDLSGNTSLATLLDLDIESCNVPSEEQKTLAANRNNVGAGDIVVYIVRNLIGVGPAVNAIGCAAMPSDKPGCVVIQHPELYVTAHEIGHVLGLRHVCQFPSPANPNPDPLCVINGSFNDSLMFPVASWTNPPPDISASEEATMLSSRHVRQC